LSQLVYVRKKLVLFEATGVWECLLLWDNLNYCDRHNPSKHRKCVREGGKVRVRVGMGSGGEMAGGVLEETARTDPCVSLVQNALRGLSREGYRRNNSGGLPVALVTALRTPQGLFPGKMEEE
jgi:hypothetical protein